MDQGWDTQVLSHQEGLDVEQVFVITGVLLGRCALPPKECQEDQYQQDNQILLCGMY